MTDSEVDHDAYLAAWSQINAWEAQMGLEPTPRRIGRGGVIRTVEDARQRLNELKGELADARSPTAHRHDYEARMAEIYNEAAALDRAIEALQATEARKGPK